MVVTFAKKEVPSLEKLIFTKIEQEQVKPSSLLPDKWQKLLDPDSVREWFKSESGDSWLNRFIATEAGKAWFEAKGKQWLESDDGQAYLRNYLHNFVETKAGKS